MQTKFLNDLVGEIAGKQGVEVLEMLTGKKDVNEFLIAKKLKLTINQARNIFYKLANFGLVSFTRKKDKRKGWYTYFWTLNTGRALELLDDRIRREIENLNHQQKSREKKNFYTCETCKAEISEETALLHNFTCQECGEVYKLSEKEKTLSELRNRIARLERQRKNVLQELEKIRQEEKKKIAKTDKRKKAKDKRERAKKKKEKAKEKIKEERIRKKEMEKSKRKPKRKPAKKPGRKKELKKAGKKAKKKKETKRIKKKTKKKKKAKKKR